MISLTENRDELNLIEVSKIKDNAIPYTWITVSEKNTRDENTVKREYTVNPMELSNWIKNNLNYIFVRGNANEGALMYIYSNGYLLYGRLSYHCFFKI